MNCELYYLFGALRDGNLDIRKGKNYELRFYQNDLSWLEFISKILRNSFRVNPKISKNILRVNNRKFVEELKKLSGYKCPQEL